MDKKYDMSANHLASRLRKDLLTRPRDSFLGSEDDVLAHYRISRPTLRQAARVLEHEQLLRVKRGPKGGYYVSRPHAGTVVRSASLYLHDQGTRLFDVIEAASGCLATITELAARSKDVEARKNLHRELDNYMLLGDQQIDHEAYFAAESSIVEAVARLAGNAPLDLIVKILYGCGLRASADRIFEGRPDRIRECIALRVLEVEAILAGDPGLAELYYKRATALRKRYIEEQREVAVQPG